jgi:hypothetical protein
VFTPLLGAKHARRAISGSIAALERKDALLAQSAKAPGMDSIGMAIVEYYTAVYAAEQAAMRKVLEAIETRTAR